MLRLRHILLPIIVLLSLVPSAYAQEDLLSRLDKATGVKLPDGYGEKVADFMKTNALMLTIMQDKDALAFTEQFIIEKMKEDWGINRQNQLLFVWEAISFVADEEIYDGDDGNEARMEEFETAFDNVEGCEKAYYDGLKARMEEISAEARQQSAEYQRQAAEAKQQSTEAKRSKITEIIATIEGYLQDIRRGLNELEKLKIDGKYALEDTEQRLEEFSKTEKDILAKYNPLKKKVQGGLNDTDLDECLSLSNQLVSATVRLVSAMYQRQSAEYKQQSAEYKQQSAEYKQQSAEYVKRIRQSSYSTLCEVVAIYKTHVEKPHLARPEEIKEVKEITAETIATCKEYDIDYKSILLDELGGDKEKLKAFLKFFGIE